MARPEIKSVAIIGAGAAGAAAAAAFAAEDYFDHVRVFERRETPGGTWIYDSDPVQSTPPQPGKLPPDIDPPLSLPAKLPAYTQPSTQERYSTTPIYSHLTTNVPNVAMSFSDEPFAYGPFVPHWVPKQYIENYFSIHRTDSLLVLSTTVEDLSRIQHPHTDHHRWALTLRRYDSVIGQDVWWKEEYDAVVLANGHYSVPFIPSVDGLDEYLQQFPGRVIHSKSYRLALDYREKTVLVIGNSASGHDITHALLQSASSTVYQSRRSPSRWDGDTPPPGLEWKPIVRKYHSTGAIEFADGSILPAVNIVIYCTGYQASFPFWNSKANGGPIWNYEENRLEGSYLHTFFREYPTLGVVGIPRTLTFRSFEYMGIALARVFSGRNAVSLPSKAHQAAWEKHRLALVHRERRKFHDIPWDNGETMEFLSELYHIAGLPRLEGKGRCPPVLGQQIRWAIEHIKKYPEPKTTAEEEGDGWVMIRKTLKDSLHFI